MQNPKNLRRAIHDALYNRKDIRSLAAEFGHVENRTFADYMYAYKLTGIAKRVIDAIVDYTWRSMPEIFEPDIPQEESKINQAFKALDKQHNLFSLFERVDTLACIGHYAVIVIGTNSPYDKPLESGASIKNIRLIHAYSEEQAQILTSDTNRKSKRYGLPETYRINANTGNTSEHYTVHHSKVIHIALDCVDNTVFGRPKLQAAYNYIHDFYKMMGSTAEMYAMGTKTKIAALLDEQLSLYLGEQGKQEIKDDLEAFSRSDQNFLVASGTQFQALPTHTPNPTQTADMLLQLIGASVKPAIPTRILLGSEQGQLASTVDKDMWLSSIRGRQIEDAEKLIICPLIDRLMQYGYIPKAKYDLQWSPLIEPQEDDKVQNALRKIQAFRQYVGQGGDITEVYPLEEFRKDMGMNEEVPETNYSGVGDYAGAYAGLPNYPQEIRMNSEKKKIRGIWRRWRNRV